MANAETVMGEPEKGASRYAWYVLSSCSSSTS